MFVTLTVAFAPLSTALRLARAILVSATIPPGTMVIVSGCSPNWPLMYSVGPT